MHGRSRDQWELRSISSAEELLEKGNPFYDLYLLDIQLGQMTGMELAEKIREKDDHAVILLQQIIKK